MPGIPIEARELGRRRGPAAAGAVQRPATAASGTASEGTRQARSPATPSTWRLVASTRTPGQPRSAASAGQAVWT